MSNTKNNILFYTAMVFAVWFSITGFFWIFLIPLVIAYPFALLSLLIWFYLKKDGNPRNKLIVKTLIVGLIISILGFFAIWILAMFK
jgi:RsiW-degrading membrane proteinase PrsW (M82 family)